MWRRSEAPAVRVARAPVGLGPHASPSRSARSRGTAGPATVREVRSSSCGSEHDTLPKQALGTVSRIDRQRTQRGDNGFVPTRENPPVELVRWPQDEVLRDRLARAGVPRLLLVDPGADTPATIGIDEDWIRLPADERDVWARAERLVRLTDRLSLDRPFVDDSRVLRRGGSTVVLTTSEAVVVRLLLDHAGSVVPRSRIETALWPTGEPPSIRAVDSVVYRLRRRLAGLNMCIRAARNSGFVVFVDTDAAVPADNP
jgi:hypothetical protein